MESKTIFLSGTVLRAALGLVLTCHSLCPKVTDLSCVFHRFQNHTLPKKLVSKMGDLSLREAASILGPRFILPKDLLGQFSSQTKISSSVTPFFPDSIFWGMILFHCSYNLKGMRTLIA